MSWGTVALTDKEFYTLMARYADVTNLSTVEKYYRAMVEVIIRELYIHQTCRLPLLGTFNVREVSEGVQVQYGPDGKEHMYKIPARIVPVFVPHDDFTNDVNMQAVTKLARRRVKNNAMTARDYQRQIRADALGVSGALSQERMDKSKKEFIEMLRKSKQKGKVDSKEDED